MAADHLVLTLSPVTPTPGVERREFLADVRAAVPGAQVVEMRQAGVPVPANEAAGIPENYFATVYVIGPTRQDSQGVTEILSGPLIIGGPDLLEALHAGDGIDALKAGKIVGIGPGTVGPEGTVGVPDPLDENFNLAAGDSGPTHPAVEAGESRYAQLGLGGSENYVVSPKEARRMGLHAQSDPAMGYWWILRAPRAIDAGTLSAAQSAAAKHQGAFISDGRYQGRSDAFIRMVLTAVAAAVALIIVGVVVALVTSESRRDHAILVAVGAGPGMRRKVVGANAWLLGTLGGLLAVPAGFLPVIVIQLARQAGRTVVVPWTAIGVAVVAVPAVAGLIAAATSRQPKAVQLLRPIA
jgi:hypothetical protein